MKKSNFIALVIGVVSGMMFSIGMCMALLPEWDMFYEGLIFGSIGLIAGLITLFVWCKKEGKKLPKVNGKNFLRAVYIVIATLILGLGMCLCLVWEQFLWGVLVGLIGIVMLLCLIPMIKGLK